MDTSEHIAGLRRSASDFAAALHDAARAGRLGATVVTCPEWTVRELASHLGGIYRWCTELVARGIVVETWRSSLPIVYPASDDAVAGWFADAIEPMLDAFTAAPGDRRVWVWGADPHARFWPRRMLHETSVHHADLVLTLDREPVIETAVAVDGIDEFLTNLPCTARWGAPIARLRGSGETLGLVARDTDDRWRLRFDPTGCWWDRSGEATDATVTGRAADLDLFLQGRARPAVTVSGRADVVQRWQDALDF